MQHRHHQVWAPPDTWPPARRLKAVIWHHGPPRRTGVSVPNPAVTDGRYHRRDGPGAWYASSSERAMWAEFDRHFVAAAVDRLHVLRRAGAYSVDLDVLDLTDDDVLKALHLDRDALVQDDLSLTQAVADAARTAGFVAVLAPSAACADATTLAVFEGGTAAVAEVDVVVRPPPAP